MVNCVTKGFKGFRFNRELYAKFKEVAERSNLMVTEAFERFMTACVAAGEVRFPEPSTPAIIKDEVETEARVLMAWLQNGQYWYKLNGKNVDVQGRLLQLLPKIQDTVLKSAVAKALVESAAPD